MHAYPPHTEVQESANERTACTYPARPINGGPLERALSKPGQWHYEPKYNGWRALLHAPSGTAFNRYGQRLSIEQEFAAALALLQKLRGYAGERLIEWFDCEALHRRHQLGRGVLLVFDYIVPGVMGAEREPYWVRKAKLATLLVEHDCLVPPQPHGIYAVRAPAQNEREALELYCRLKQLNAQWRCPFYEGVVAKRADSIYPVQLRSAGLEFAGWMKHRWSV